MESAKKEHPDAEFIAWLGDNPSSNFYELYKKDHIEIFGNVTEKFKKYYPTNHNAKTLLYPIVGNHEGIPCDSMDFVNKNSEKWPLNIFSKLWAPYLTPDCIFVIINRMKKHYGNFLRKDVIQ